MAQIVLLWFFVAMALVFYLATVYHYNKIYNDKLTGGLTFVDGEDDDIQGKDEERLETELSRVLRKGDEVEHIEELDIQENSLPRISNISNILYTDMN